ncbi:MAG: 50S ribosomal protein L4 [Proteobacteria bacterium]|jgi:large subunit ribosomal protein L4|nr:50S ribosomal protein L4 [Pseudomonadota bacterium]
MDLAIVKSGKKSGSVSVSEAVFGADYNEALIHQVVTAYQAGARQGTRAQKNRSAVSGGGAKPFRQKGTGRARAGTTRGPIWRGGGRTFPSSTQDFSHKVNRKSYRAAMRSILSELVRQERFEVVKELKISKPKTKAFLKAYSAGRNEAVLIIADQFDENLILSTRNLINVFVVESDEVNPFSLVGFDRVLITENAVKQLEERFQ